MTTKVFLPAAVAAALVASPAMAHKPDDPSKPEHAGKPAQPVKAESDHNGEAKSEGKSNAGTRSYVAAGTLVSQALTKNADGSYDGTLSAAVTKTNKHARAQNGTTQNYTLDNVQLKFNVPDRDANGAVDAADLRAGDRVKVTGRITKVKKSDPTVTPTVTIKKVRFNEPKAA